MQAPVVLLQRARKAAQPLLEEAAKVAPVEMVAAQAPVVVAAPVEKAEPLALSQPAAM